MVLEWSKVAHCPLQPWATAALGGWLGLLKAPRQLPESGRDKSASGGCVTLQLLSFHLGALGTLCSMNGPRRPAELWESRNISPWGPAFLLGPDQKVLVLGLVPQVQRGYVVAKK